jgi:hypothetical protein
MPKKTIKDIKNKLFKSLKDKAFTLVIAGMFGGYLYVKEAIDEKREREREAQLVEDLEKQINNIKLIDLMFNAPHIKDKIKEITDVFEAEIVDNHLKKDSATKSLMRVASIKSGYTEDKLEELLVELIVLHGEKKLATKEDAKQIAIDADKTRYIHAEF